MKNISVMLKPASGLCNMRCGYCFYADVQSLRETPSYGIMSAETAHGIADNVLSGLRRGGSAVFAFQGGEPMLAGNEFFRDFFSYTMKKAAENGRGIAVEFALQTNGSLIDREFCAILQSCPVLVGLSLDGGKELHDEYRRDAEGKGTFSRVMRAKSLLEEYKIEYNVLTVLTNRAARHPQKLWNFIVRERIGYVQFIPCLDELRADKPSPYALSPRRFYSFYSALFPLWERRLRQGEYISIKLFDDLANYYIKGVPTACGIDGRCNVQLVCEADGSVFPCDFYMLDRFKMGNLAREEIESLVEKSRPFLSCGKDYLSQPPCSGCRYQSSCGGGCKRMQSSMYIEDGICWYARLLDEILGPLLRAVRGN